MSSSVTSLNILYKSTILGCLCGDAAGASLEFYRGIIDDAKANHAMHMPGGGSLNIGPGQITDDGELTLTLFQVLSQSSDNLFPLNDIAQAYISWYKKLSFTGKHWLGNDS